MTSRATFEKNADLLARFLRGVETCIGDMIAKSDNLEPVISSMTAKYEIPEAKRPDHGIPVLQNGLRHTFVAPYRDKLASSPARWNTAYDLMLKAGIVPPLEKRDFYDDGARKLAFG